MTLLVPYDLERFVAAQESTYANALAELRRGRKESHWMWFVFPQIAGLGQSATARRYAIGGRHEARDYLAHPVLGPRLRECTRVVNALPTRSAEAVFGSIDAVKLRSSMTLFKQESGAGEPFQECLDRYFGGAEDEATLRLLAGSGADR